MVYVKNARGTSEVSPSCRRCGPWKDHWSKFSGKQFHSICGALGCSSPAEVGAHVLKVDLTEDKTRYIVPLCPGCNMRADVFVVAWDLVPAAQCE